jgi:hypothetical protein
MFEKEATQYALEWGDKTDGTYACFRDGYLAGAEFGYNKANEWHYVKDGDLPTKKLEEKQLLVRVRNYTEDYILAYYMIDKYYSKNGKRFYSDTDCDYPIDIKNIIAWKEIVLPELPKKSE